MKRRKKWSILLEENNPQGTNEAMERVYYQIMDDVFPNASFGYRESLDEIEIFKSRSIRRKTLASELEKNKRKTRFSWGGFSIVAASLLLITVLGMRGSFGTGFTLRESDGVVSAGLQGFESNKNSVLGEKSPGRILRKTPSEPSIIEDESEEEAITGIFTSVECVPAHSV